jgi:hypothetical protein
MKNGIKRRLNKAFYYLFGHMPFPSNKEELKFIRRNYPIRDYSCDEFNEISLNIHKLNNY